MNKTEAIEKQEKIRTLPNNVGVNMLGSQYTHTLTAHTFVAESVISRYNSDLRREKMGRCEESEIISTEIRHHR